MRVRTAEKRAAIIKAATVVFEELGYERASMSAIAARIGGSKATLYGYFSSKESLFAASITHALSERGNKTLDLLSSSGDLFEVLVRFGRGYLEFITQPEILAIQRTVINDGVATGLGRELYNLGPHIVLTTLADFFAAREKAGELKLDSPEIAAYFYKGLLEAGVTEPLLYGSEHVRSLEDAARTAARAFVKIYG